MRVPGIKVLSMMSLAGLVRVTLAASRGSRSMAPFARLSCSAFVGQRYVLHSPVSRTGATDVARFSTVDKTESISDHADDASNSTETSERKERPRRKKGNTRFRQHVNPLSRRFQAPVELIEGWPVSIYSDMSRPLHLDIGCGKGGFLLDFATSQLQDTQQEVKKNYLGLEIRPGVAHYAQDRILKRPHLHGHLSFIGCNANVDLQRILSLYMSGENGAELGSVSIQFPDPHFKSQHVKRRVVNHDLVLTLAKFMKEGRTLFIQSDVQELLDDMRERIREQSIYFEDEIEDITEYMLENPLGVPTEREISVLAKDLPVYRTIFRRTSVAVVDVDVDTVDE
eukprot:scaffold7174_cov55-Attheya_sp.AAC.2